MASETESTVELALQTPRAIAPTGSPQVPSCSWPALSWWARFGLPARDGLMAHDASIATKLPEVRGWPLIRSDAWGAAYADALAAPLRAAGDPVRTVAFRLSHRALGDHTAEVRDLAREVTALGVDERTTVVLVAWEGEDLEILRLAALDPALSRVRWLAEILYPSLTDGCMPVPPCVPEAPAFALAARLWGQESRIELGDTTRRVWEKARASLGREPRLEHLYLYDALQVAARAVLTADPDDGDAIAAAFPGAAASYAALTGPIRFDANGDRLPNELAYYGLFRTGAPTGWRHFAYFDTAARRLTLLDPPRPRPAQFCPEC